MATNKSYTDIEQSKKLAEILPLESADMFYILMPDGAYNHFPLTGRKTELAEDTDLPCWSLSALIKTLPNGGMLVKTSMGMYYCFEGAYMTEHYNEPIDAVYQMLLELKR